MNDKNKEPLKESIDYPDFVSSFVKKKLAERDVQVSAELAGYIAEDIEDYVLTVGKNVDDLTEAEMFHIEMLIDERVAESRDILPSKGA